MCVFVWWQDLHLRILCLCMYACALRPSAQACELRQFVPHDASQIVHTRPGPHRFASGSRFESEYLAMHWSDCHDHPSTMVLQTVLVTIMFSSLAPMHAYAHDIMPRTSTNETQALMAANRPPDRPHIAHGIQCFISTHQWASGDGLHAGMTGVCNNHCTITYMHHRHEFPIQALGFSSFSRFESVNLVMKLSELP